MVYNRFLGRKEICKVMLEHTAAQVGLSRLMRKFGERYGFIYIKLFGYPPVPASRILARKTLRFLHQKEKGLLLDVGCSHGAYSFELARMGFKVIGIDTNEESISVAQNIKGHLGLQNVNFLHIDILSNNFSEKKFNFIIILETLEHIKEDGKVIQEFNRILKDNGAIIISVPYAKNVQEYDEPVGACRIKEDTYICIGKGGSHYRNGYNLGRMRMLLVENGFFVESWEYLCIPKLLESSFLSFPLKYLLSLLLTNFSKNRVKLIVIARKASINSKKN